MSELYGFMLSHPVAVIGLYMSAYGIFYVTICNKERK